LKEILQNYINYKCTRCCSWNLGIFNFI